MPEEHGVIRRIVWHQICPWLILFRVFRLSISLPVLLLGGVGALLTPLGWQLADFVFIDEQQDAEFQRIVDRHASWAEFDHAPIASFHRGGQLDGTRLNSLANVPKVYLRFTEPLWQLALASGPDAETRIPRVAYFLFGGLWNFAVWSLFAGAITRIAGVYLGREERVGLKDALRHALRNYGWYFVSPFFPLLGVLLLAIPLVLLGLLMQIAFGALLAGLCWFLALISGLAIAVLLLGLIFGWPLMWPAISCEEGGDAFDAFSRSYSYTFQRPLHYLFFAVIVVLFGGLCWLFVSQFSLVIVELPLWIAAWGAGPERMEVLASGQNDGLLWVAGALIRWYNRLVTTLAYGFNYSFFFCSATAVYLLLRREYDQTELDEIFVVEQEEQYGLPPLAMEEPSTGPQED